MTVMARPIPRLSEEYGDRALARIEWPSFITGCWLWRGGMDGKGYGISYIDKRTYRAHRVVYTLFRGDVPLDLELDHLCRVRRCVNPLHLEAVTGKVNRSRGIGHPNCHKTECDHGHPFDAANTYWFRGVRNCRACNRRRAAELKARKRKLVAT